MIYRRQPKKASLPVSATGMLPLFASGIDKFPQFVRTGSAVRDMVKDGAVLEVLGIACQCPAEFLLPGSHAVQDWGIGSE